MKLANRVSVGVALSLLILTAFTACQANAESFTVGVLNLSHDLDPVLDGFKAGMTELGYVEGQNLTYIYHGPTGSISGLEAEAELLLEQEIDLLLALSTPAALQAKRSTEESREPVVFARVYDPVRSELVESLTRPGGNLTGVKTSGQTAKALEWHLQAAPDTKFIFVPHNPKDKASVQNLSDLQKAAKSQGVELIVFEASTAAELAVALNNIPAEADGIWMLTSGILTAEIDQYVMTAIEHRLPLSSGSLRHDQGIMISYGSDLFGLGKPASRLAHKIFRGVDPVDLPVETSNFVLGINLLAARKSGLVIPESLLLEANEIVR